MKRFYFFLVLGALVLPSLSWGADNKLAAAARAISVYPADVRAATQTALGYPATLVQLGQIQTKSSGDFKKLVAPLSTETEKKLWLILRSPRLLQDLVVLGPNGEGSSVIKNYPKEVQPAAKDLLKNNFDLLRESAAIGNKAQAEFGAALGGLPAPAVAAFQSVGGHSEIFQVLNQALGLSTINPDNFRKDPKPLTQTAQQLASLIATAPPSSPQKNVTAAPGDNPQAVSALDKADKSFKAQNDYELDQDPYPKGAVQVNVGYTPDSSLFQPIGWAYPFWFGFPDWDPFPFW